MNPMPLPERPGAPCWDPAYAEAMISAVARIGDSYADWFLATHSPITCTLPGTGDLSQEAIFDRLFNSAGEEFVAVVKGGPGAGKSQLINWLKLRFDESLSSGAHPAHRKGKLRTVMIKRRSGSLKDALQQLVEQLPGYQGYLTDVSAAISVLGGEHANRDLCFALCQTIRAAREQEVAPDRRWKHLSELFQDVSIVDYLARDGGVVAACIAHLTTGAKSVEGEALPAFTAEELAFPKSILRRTAVNQHLLDKLADEDRSYGEATAAEVNRHLRTAIAALTGLRGTTLHEVFRSIRKDLKEAGECLAFFVEDVSTLSILDEELVNAVEPQNDPLLCEMVSVLGMTIPAFARLPQNLVDRLSLAVEIKGEQVGRSELTESPYADQFIGRYLNAVRAGSDQLGQLASGIRRSGDLTDSACDECRLRAECFSAFGSVTLGHANVGLFPFSQGSASRLLAGLDSRTPATPRSLLRKIVAPLLEAASTQFSRVGSTVGLDVEPRRPGDLSAKRGVLLGGWPHPEQDRLTYLTWYWAGTESLEQGAGRLKPMLPWFGLRPFSAAVATIPLAPAAPNTPAPQPPVPPDVPLSAAYRESVQQLDVWYQKSATLEKDKEPRNYLVDLLKNSIVVESYRTPSADQRSRTRIDASSVEIKGMKSRPMGGRGAIFEFPRNQETHSLLLALTDYYIRGKRTWDFEGGESQRRVYAKWLRANQARMIQSFGFEAVDPQQAHRIAVRFLVMAYRYSEKKELPRDTSGVVQSLLLFKPKSGEPLSPTGKTLSSILNDWVERIRTFLISGLNVPQGETSSVNFIDPCVIIQTLSDDPNPITLPAVDERWESGHFSTISRLCKSAWSDLNHFIEEETAALATRVEGLRYILRQWSIASDSLEADLREYCESARQVVKEMDATNQSGGDLELQKRIAGLAPAEISRQITEILKAAKVTDGDRAGVITFDTSVFIKQAGFLEQVHAFMTRQDEALKVSGQHIRTMEELELERDRAQKLLSQLAVVAGEAR